MSTQNHRFSGANWFADIQNKTVEVIGAGGTGSWTATILSRLKPKSILVSDDDIIEEHNVGVQCFNYFQIDNIKVYALKNNILNLSDYTILVLCDRVNMVTARDITICAVDSMRSRKELFENWVLIGRTNSIFIDPRVAAESFEIYFIRHGDLDTYKAYRERLFSDEQGSLGACNLQQCTHTSSMAASWIVMLITQWITELQMDIKLVPFKTQFNLQTGRLIQNNPEPKLVEELV